MTPKYDSRLIQIIPAPAGWIVATFDDNGNPKSAKVQFIGLDDAGQTWFLFPDDGRLRQSAKARFVGNG